MPQVTIEIQRIHAWINNSPNVAETNTQSTSEAPVTPAPVGTLSTHTTVPPPQNIEKQAITEAVVTTTEVTGGLILTASVPQTFTSTLPVPTTLQVAPPTNSPTGVPAVSVPSLTVPMTSSITSTQIINTPNQAASQQPSGLFNPTASVPVSHILPNMSAWTFRTVTTSPPTQLRTPLQTSQPTISTTTTTSVESTPVTTIRCPFWL